MKWFEWFFAACTLASLLFFGIMFYDAHRDCKERGGKLVRGVFGGMECVEAKR
jgi:hypothetical protein